eukprot:RCo042262
MSSRAFSAGYRPRALSPTARFSKKAKSPHAAGATDPDEPQCFSLAEIREMARAWQEYSVDLPVTTPLQLHHSVVELKQMVVQLLSELDSAQAAAAASPVDRKSGVEGKRVNLGGG